MTNRYRKIFLVLFAALSFSALFLSCSGKPVDDNDPKSVFEDAEEDIKDERYQMALEKLKNVKNKFPYSHYSTLAQLKIADVYFAEESFIEAAGAYETFRDLHPKHPKADYVLFQIGESYFFQLPDAIDRDLSPANKALEAYRELLGVYPKSENAGKARDRIKESLERLSEKERYIANFYFKQDQFDSAALRYGKVTRQYPGTTPEEGAYQSWAESLIAQSKQKEFAETKPQLLEEVSRVYETYLSKYPSGKYEKTAKKWLDKNRNR